MLNLFVLLETLIPPIRSNSLFKIVTAIDHGDIVENNFLYKITLDVIYTTETYNDYREIFKSI